MWEPELTPDKAVTAATQVESAGQQAKTADDSVCVLAVQPRPQPSENKNKQFTRPNKPSSAILHPPAAAPGVDLTNIWLIFPGALQPRQHVSLIIKLDILSKITGVDETQLPKLTVLSLKDPCYAPKTLLSKINISAPASPITEHELVVDSGSAASILPQHICDKYFCYTPLLPPTRKLVTYTSRSISVHGCLQIKVS